VAPAAPTWLGTPDRLAEDAETRARDAGVVKVPASRMARPTKEPPIASSIVPLIVRHAAAREVDVEALRLRFDLPPDAASLDRVTVAPLAPNDLLHAVARAAAEDDVALRLAAELTSRRHKLTELAVRASADVRAALARLARWAPLIHEGLAGALDEGCEDGEARWAITTPRRPRGIGRYVHELAVAHALHHVRAGVDSFTPRHAWFAHPRPSDVAPLCAFLGTTDVAFGCEDSGFAVAEGDLARPMRGADPHTVESLAPLVDAELPELRASSFAARVAASIASTLPEEIAMAEAAARLHMSPRTLQRRLEEEGTRFSEVVEDARLELARRLLADPSVTLGDVAYRTGFSDLATFSRAFKRWTGQPPGQWRRS
jgi:AraC-like DNA-binding protein